MADPHVCERCAMVERTCCRLDPGNEASCFPLSQVERDRIVAEVGDGVTPFALEDNTGEFTENVKSLFPRQEELVAALFPVGEKHHRLATDADGACRLLGPNGCVLSREARPYYCRMFPLWPFGRSVRVFAFPTCLAYREGQTLYRILRLIGTTEQRLRDLQRELREAWGLPDA